MLKQVAAAALTIGAAARITRFITTDSLGELIIKEPIRSKSTKLDPRWDEYIEGLECPHCVGFWATAAVMGAGAAMKWGKVWQWGAGVWAASYAVGHLVARIDAADDDDDTIKLSGLPMSGITMQFGEGGDDEDD